MCMKNKPTEPVASPARLDLLAARKAKNLTQQDLAQVVGCGIATIQNCERKGKLPRGRALRRSFIAALGLSELA